MDIIRQQVLALTPSLCALRRELHAYPETAWCEYRTAALVARHLLDLGYAVTMGADAVVADQRLNPPSPEQCRLERARAVADGADPVLVARMDDGLTGLWADLDCPGDIFNDTSHTTPHTPHSPKDTVPLLALRFDMDANNIHESTSSEHRPHREGFGSRRQGYMHACGHDTHTAMGMVLAGLLKVMRPHLRGTVRLIFQPAEEGGQGAVPMLAAGAVQGVDTLIGVHVGVKAGPTGEVVCGTTHFLASTNFEMTFEGRAAHAGLIPHEGRNALLAACAAVQGIYAISRHGEGPTRMNVGQLVATGASNVIPQQAWLAGETRGLTDALNTFVLSEAERIAQGAAHMWGCACHTRHTGAGASGTSSPELVQCVAAVARTLEDVTHVVDTRPFWASEDFTWMMNHVIERGGQSTYIQLGTDKPGGHHTDIFDVDDRALSIGLELLARIVLDILGKK